MFGSNLLFSCAMGMLAAPSEAAQDQPKAPVEPGQAAAPLFTPAEVRLMELEGETKKIRDEVRVQLADAAFSLEQATQQAKQAWTAARTAREQAEAVVRQHQDSLLPHQVEMAKIEIEGAKAMLESSRERQRDLRQRRARGQELHDTEFLMYQLEVQRGEFEVEQAETLLVVLERYTGPKEGKRLRSLLEQASAEEALKHRQYDIEAAKLRRRRTESARLQARTPEDYVVKLLEEVVDRETRIIDLTKEIGAIRAEMAADADPGHASNYLDRIKTNQAAIENTTRQIKEGLTEATTLAEETRQARARLLQAEKRLSMAHQATEKSAQ